MFTCSRSLFACADVFLLGHYIENTSDTEKLVWIELYKSDRVADISLAQWLALTPADTVANVLKIDIEVVKRIKKEKQILVQGKK
jgi:oxalate decarboxylase/phosphoglucose isomerase-like protein (cupin superfamily)